MVPDGWDLIPLGRLGTFIHGDRGKNYTSRKSFVESGIPFISAGHLKDGHIDSSRMNYISEDSYNRLNSGKIHDNDILYCHKGSLGKLAKGFDRGAIASSVVIIRPHRNVNPEYLFQLLVSPLGKEITRKLGCGSAIPGISTKALQQYVVPVPPLPEQRKIAAILSSVDGANENTQAIIDQVQVVKKGLMQNLLGRYSFGQTDVTACDGEIVPEGRKDAVLGSVLTLEYGKALPNSKRVAGPYPVFGSNGIIGTHLKALLKGPGIIVGEQGTIGAVRWSDEDFWPIDTSYFVNPLNRHHLRWLYYLLQYLPLKRMNSGTYVPILNRNDAYRLPIRVPPLSEQYKIAAILYSVDNFNEKSQAVIDQVQVVKKGLMQELLTRGLPRRLKRFKQTEIGEVPEDWEVALLDAVAKRGSGHTPDKKHPEYWDGPIKWVSLKDSHRLDKVYIKDTTAKITELGIANSSAVEHPPGTVVLSRDAGVGKSAITETTMASALLTGEVRVPLDDLEAT